MKAKTRTWSDVVKGMNIEDELETTNSDNSMNESGATDLVEQFDSKEPLEGQVGKRAVEVNADTKESTGREASKS